MPNKTIRVSKDIKETRQIAKIFLKEILKNRNMQKGAIVVGLSGDLGSGKTAFVQSVAKHLNIKNKINSPTFVIIKKYIIKKTKDYNFLFHLDAYRLKNEKELSHLGWEEIIKEKGNLVFIEWPENVQKIIPKDSFYVYFSHQKNGSRKLEFR
ncbi:MAG: tRNA (adenosine(37)-N6)-threonylcarbamoyltransferase complex ATPase subunit type 1 TsaE [Candidatus Paceibacterota bacterium]